MTTNLKYQKSEMPKSDEMTDHLKFQNVTCVDFGWTLTRLIVNVMQARKVAPPFGIWPLGSNKAKATKDSWRQQLQITKLHNTKSGIQWRTIKIHSCTIQKLGIQWMKYQNTTIHFWNKTLSAQTKPRRRWGFMKKATPKTPRVTKYKSTKYKIRNMQIVKTQQ